VLEVFEVCVNVLCGPCGGAVSLPKGCGRPLDVTLEQALAAVAAKEAHMRARGRDPYEVSA
jgi:hypothetical protein